MYSIKPNNDPEMPRYILILSDSDNSTYEIIEEFKNKIDAIKKLRELNKNTLIENN
jgi:hypothetical protein